MNTHNTTQPRLVAGILRIALGFIFLWAFFDKLFGLGFATAANNGWLDGGSPTLGFLKFSSKGPFQSFFHSIAGTPLVNWLFMLGLLGIGTALILGIAIRFASICATALMVLMWLVVLPPTQNPIIDDHIIYGLVFVWMATFPFTFSRLSLYTQWLGTRLVRACSCMK